jgi:ABC-type polysaccharide/polyol phosphate transport system ATPase subunit
MDEIAISLDNITKKYCLYRRKLHRVVETFHPTGKKYHRPFYALKNFNLRVRKNESIGIIGRNGSGKSTLLQLICGILTPTEGNLRVNGRISALLELGAGFNPEYTGRENVYLNTSILGLSKQETDERFASITEFADIGDFIDRPVKMYSSGMYVRLAFATAVSIDPDILIVDEALAVGDIFFQQKCVARMREMIKSCTIVVVSHDMHAISNLCNRVVVLDHGVTIYDGKPIDGIALYTKLMHDERYGDQTKVKKSVEEIPDRIIDRTLTKQLDFNDWLPVPADRMGGAGVVDILRVSVTKNGKPFKTIQLGEFVEIRMLVRSKRTIDDVIFGYTVKDRVGVAVFGENSLCLTEKISALEEGFSIIEYSFSWPEVYPEEYTLTLGVGEGKLPLVHTIQCWAHNVVSFSAVTPDRSIHGIFNNPLNRLSIELVE